MLSVGGAARPACRAAPCTPAGSLGPQLPQRQAGIATTVHIAARRPLPPPHASAAAGAPADEPSSSDVAPPTSAKRVTIDQWWRSYRYKQKEASKLRKEAFMRSEFVVKTQEALAKLDEAMKPVYIAMGIIALWYNQRIEKYMEFCYMETRRIWAWKRRTEAERAFWGSVCCFVRGLVSTLVYEAVVPVSVLWGIALPLYLAWVLDDKLWESPILWGMLLIAPLKFVPGWISWV